MTTPTPADRLAADLADVEREMDRVDALGDAAAVVRLRILLGPRVAQLRRALATAERDKKPAFSRTQGVNG